MSSGPAGVKGGHVWPARVFGQMVVSSGLCQYPGFPNRILHCSELINDIQLSTSDQVVYCKLWIFLSPAKQYLVTGKVAYSLKIVCID